MKRVEILMEIADRYWELVDPNHCNGQPGSGDRVPQMPSTYTASVREFERLLGVMRNQAKQRSYKGVRLGTLRWQVLAWHVDARKVIRHEPIMVLVQGKWRRSLHEDGTVRTRPAVFFVRDPGAREAKAQLGLEWMAENWGLLSEPMLPDELLVAA